MTGGNKIGVLGGAFDPVHNGHLEMARAARKSAGLDRVIFVPAAVSPYKTGEPSTPAADRLAMLRLATADRPEWSVSEIELDRGGISYTIDTIRGLRSELGPDPEFHLIIGMDNFLEIAGWRDIGSVIELARFIVVARPGCEPGRISGENRYRAEQIRGRDRLITVELSVPVSSSEIRRMVRAGKDPRPYLPPAVADYIKGHRLYRDGEPGTH
jgi:nicotinate-nucleotide adenylyltransferase